jgi:cytochrome oxidase Cu insertion factor (SCO1/SenC/PrrC family)
MGGSKITSRLNFRAIFFAITALFLLPLVFLWGYTWYQNRHGQQPYHPHRQLLTSLFRWDHLPLFQVDGSPVKGQFFRGHWTLVTISSGQCNTLCLKSLKTISQLVIAMTDKKPELQRVVLTFPSVKKNAVLAKTIATQFPGIHVFLVNPHQYRGLVKKHVNIKEAMHQGAFFVVDPKGNVLRFYAANSDPVVIFQDVKYLLAAGYLRQKRSAHG